MVCESSAYTRLLLIWVLIVSVRATQIGRGLLTTTIASSGDDWSLRVNGVEWFRSAGEVALHVNNKWLSSRSSHSLRLIQSSNTTGKDRLGNFQAAVFNWSAPEVPGNVKFSTSVRVYLNTPVAIFSTHFPHGLNNTYIKEIK